MACSAHAHAHCNGTPTSYVLRAASVCTLYTLRCALSIILSYDAYDDNYWILNENVRCVSHSRSVRYVDCKTSFIKHTLFGVQTSFDLLLCLCALPSICRTNISSFVGFDSMQIHSVWYSHGKTDSSISEPIRMQWWIPQGLSRVKRIRRRLHHTIEEWMCLFSNKFNVDALSMRPNATNACISYVHRLHSSNSTRWI